MVSLRRCLGVFGALGPMVGFLFAVVFSAVLSEFASVEPTALGSAVLDAVTVAALALAGCILRWGLARPRNGGVLLALAPKG